MQKRILFVALFFKKKTRIYVLWCFWRMLQCNGEKRLLHVAQNVQFWWLVLDMFSHCVKSQNVTVAAAACCSLSESIFELKQFSCWCMCQLFFQKLNWDFHTCLAPSSTSNNTCCRPLLNRKLTHSRVNNEDKVDLSFQINFPPPDVFGF